MLEHTRWHISPTRRWSLWLLGCLLVVLPLTFAACNGSDDDDDVPVPPLPTLNPGETLTLGTTVMLTMNGAYLLPAGATSITTRCLTGEVSVTIETVPGSLQTNMCSSSTGSSRMTNDVTGASEVTYDFGAGASAEVTVN